MGMAPYLEDWENVRSARLRHLTFQLTDSQKELVQRALQRAQARGIEGTGNPNISGNALDAICRAYLEVQP